MGLELAEFLLAIEDEFQVDIFGADFSYIQTLDDFITILEKETALAPHNQAQADRLFQEQFLVIQNFFAKELGVEHSQLTPETNTALLLRSLSSRRRIWKKMRKEISESIPPLYGKEYREWLGGISVFFAFVFGLILSIEWGVIASIFYGPFLFGILYLVFVGVWHFCFSWLFSTIPKDCASLEDITRNTVRKISLDSDGKIWTRETITKTVVRITSEQLGIPVEKISLTEKVSKML